MNQTNLQVGETLEVLIISKNDVSEVKGDRVYVESEIKMLKVLHRGDEQYRDILDQLPEGEIN